MKKIVCVQGLGFVGAAMAVAIAMAKTKNGRPIYEVVGVDLDNEVGVERVTSINNGKFPFHTTDENLIAAIENVHLSGNLRATTDPKVYSEADIIVVNVQLDIAFGESEPELVFNSFNKAIEAAALRMRRDTLMIVETTVPPGTCEKIVIPTVSKIFLERNLDPEKFLLAHSYERVMPGKNYLNSIINFWRVFSGRNEESADLCKKFFASVINTDDFPLTQLASTTASETAKVMENAYRAVNIAFIAEWVKFAESAGVDLIEVIDAIKQRPTHANIRYPGLGVGGYCLTKDPAFAPAAARELFGLNLDFPFSNLAIRECMNMPQHAIDKIRIAMGNDLSGTRILILGVSYRPDVSDTRFSPSEVLYHGLTQLGAEVDVHDPLVDVWEEVGVTVMQKVPDLTQYDAVIFAVAHEPYRQLDLIRLLGRNERLIYVLDAFVVFDKDQRNAFRSAGINFEALGVGD